MLRLLHNAIAEAAPDAEIIDFLLGPKAVSHIQTHGVFPDVVFADIQMPGLTGLELAVRLKELAPETKIVFVTGYDYALDAWHLHVDGYIIIVASLQTGSVMLLLCSAFYNADTFIVGGART